jgi:Mlc titration factor MtfA (ptsG expression regulator)
MPFWRHRSDPDPLPDDWEDVVAGRVHGWWDLPVDTRTAIRDVMEPLLAQKRWEAARGFELTEEVRLVIASQAARLVIALDPPHFPNVGSIIVHASPIVSAEERPGPASGVASDDEHVLVGEASHGKGPIVIVWDDLVWELRHPRGGRNVVIHEFAHKLDMLDDVVDGTPPMGTPEQLERWIDVCTKTYEHLVQHGSPVLDDYGATEPGEFFAVASEAFFMRPGALHRHHPQLHEVLVDFYRQDPPG